MQVAKTTRFCQEIIEANRTALRGCPKRSREKHIARGDSPSVVVSWDSKGHPSRSMPSLFCATFALKVQSM